MRKNTKSEKFKYSSSLKKPKTELWIYKALQKPCSMEGMKTQEELDFKSFNTTISKWEF